MDEVEDMGNIIKTEFLKLKRYYVVKAGIIMTVLSPLLTLFYSTANDGQTWTFDYFMQQVMISNCTLFFPIIITAWIIERASITWEEDGPVNATREIIFSILVAIITYFVICNNYIRHIMFAFNELNLVILFIVMLLGTYTGYRLTELKRFSPLAKKG